MPDPLPPGTLPPSFPVAFAAAGAAARPASFGRLLGLGFGAALRLAWAVPLQAAVVWLARAVTWTPVVLAFGIARSAVERGADPLAALARAATAPGVLLPAAGLAITLGLLAAVGQAAIWAGLTGSLAASARNRGKAPPLATFAAALGERFSRFLALGVAVALGALAWFGATWSLLVAGARLYLDATARGQGGAWSAAALATGGALYLVGTPLLALVARLAASRLATGTRSALAALHEGAGLLFRRPFAIVGGALFARLFAGIAAAIVAGPGALLPPAPWPFLLARLGFAAAADLVLAFGMLAELGFLVVVAVDDREGLPPR